MFETNYSRNGKGYSFMASFSDVAGTLPTQSLPEARLRSLLQLRTLIGCLLCFGGLLFTFGGAWDVVSHRTVGRDATFSPAHVTMLTALALMGLAAMTLVLSETGRARRDPGIRNYGVTFAGGFFGPQGAYLTGFGVVASAIAFPLDNYWHSLYGIDVSLWGPFHVMILMGALLASIGASYLLISTAYLAASQHAKMVRRLCIVAAMMTLTDVAGKLINIVEPALSTQGLVQLPIGSFDLYPTMIATSAMIGLLAAAFASRWAATIVALIHIAINIVLAIVVPPVMAWQIRFEQETVLTRAAQSTVREGIRHAMLTPVLLLGLALLIDGVIWYARHKNWTLRSTLRTLFVTTLPMLLVIALVGLTTFHEQRGLQGQATASGGLTALGLSTILLSLILMPVGGLVGVWIGQTMGRSLQREGQ